MSTIPPHRGRIKGGPARDDRPPIDRVLEALGENARPSGDGWAAKCPAHDDRRASLSVNVGDGGTVLLKCHAGCKTADVVEALGLTVPDLFPPSADLPPPKRPPQRATPGRTFPTAAAAVEDLERRLGRRAGLWTYHDPAGEPVMVVVRFDRPGGSKEFRPIHRTATGWAIEAMPKPRLLYRLPEVNAAMEVVVCEGEKAADAARSLGLVATTSAGGAEAPGHTDWSPLAGKTVVILPDNDGPGRRYAGQVAGILAKLTPAPTVKVVDLPGLPSKGDIVDWVAARAGATTENVADELNALIANCPATTAPALDGHRRPDERWQPTLIRADRVTLREIRWHWRGRIPAGRLTLLSGRPGASKSVVTCFIAAVTTTGGLWPDGGIAPIGSVIFLAAEDDPADTVCPRLKAAGADLSKVALLDGKQAVDPADPDKVLKLSITLADIDQIAAALDAMPDCKLIVIDPIGSYMGGRIDSHRDTEVRSVLAPLAQLARDRNVAVLMVAHTNKAMNQFADDSVLGSRAFVGIARSVLHFTTDPDDRERKLLLPGKNNLAKELPGLAYRVESDPTVIGHPPKVVWEDEPLHGVTADDYLGAAAGRGEGGGGRQAPSRVEALGLLERVLSDGPMAISVIKEEAKAAGISWPTVQRAATELGVAGKPQKGRFEIGKRPTYFWFVGDDWEPPTVEEWASRTQTRDAHGEKEGQNTAESPEKSRRHQPPNPGDADGREVDADAHGDVDGRSVSISTPSASPDAEVDADGKSQGKVADSDPQSARQHHQAESWGKTAPPDADGRSSTIHRKKPGPVTPPEDPPHNPTPLPALLRQSGWGEPEAIGWLEAQQDEDGDSEYVPDHKLANLTGRQQKLLAAKLAEVIAERAGR